MSHASLQPQEIDVVWSAALQLLRHEVTDAQYHSYVTLAQPAAESSAGELHLKVPSDAIATWLRTNLAERIEQLVARPYGLRIIIDVEYTEDLFSQPPDPAEKDNELSQPPLVAAPAPAPVAPGLHPAAALANANANANGRPQKVVTNERTVTGLSPDLTFASFVSGPSNEIAYSAALKLATEPNAARTASPLYIHGSVGLGKTHLAQAIGNRFLERNPGARLRVLSGEQFMREVQSNFLNNNIQSFRTRFRKLDLLVLDDIQMIGRDSEQTHKQFLGLFNYMDENNLPIVITSDRPVRLLNRSLPVRLLSRVSMGLDVTVATPDLDTRIGILRSQARLMLGRELPEATAQLLASRLRNNCRELIGALRRLSHYADFRQSDLTPELAGLVLKENAGVALDLSPREIIEHTARHHKLRSTDLQSKRRTQGLVRARHVAMFLCRELTEISLPEIGNCFSCHHSSVIHAWRKINTRLHDEPDFAHEINTLRQELAG